MKSCIIIPARLGSSRLPNKILADINGKPMILRVFENCQKANCGDVFVATDSSEVKLLIENAGGRAILTSPELPSGSDRIFNALKQIDPNEEKYEVIINVQGDVPNISPSVIFETANLINAVKEADITTPVVLIDTLEKIEKPNVVKAILSFRGSDYAKALYFTRVKAPFGEGDFFEHIGLYVYRRKALEKFVSLPVSNLEKRESLEQLRAIEANLQIFAKLVEFKPISVDIMEDLENARKIIK